MKLDMHEIKGWTGHNVRGRLLNLLEAHPFKPWTGLGLGDERALAEYFLSFMAGQANRLVVAEAAGETAGCALFHRLAWDSDLFGLPMGRIEALVAAGQRREVLNPLVRHVLALCRADGIRHLSVRVDMADVNLIHVLESQGFYLVDTLQTLQGSGRPPEEPEGVEPYRPEHLDRLLAIASESLERSRFMADPYLDKDRARQVYPRWVIDAVEGRAQYVGVSRTDGEVSGFVVCLKNAVSIGGREVAFGILDLLAVDRSLQGRGVGRNLVRAARQWLTQNTDLHFVGTRSDNYAALATYLKCGFKFYSGKVGFHRWLR